MSRPIYTEQDIIDLYRQGVRELELEQDARLTDLAREKMAQLGMQMRAGREGEAAHAAMGREAPLPYGQFNASQREALIEKVRTGVLARVGGEVDPAQVDAIVRRVVERM